MARKDRKTSWSKRIAYLIMVLTGSGVGGWQLQDHPVLQKALAYLLGSEEMPTDVAEVAKKGVAKLVSSTVDNSRPGIYEARIDEVTLDPKSFRSGQNLEINVRVRSIGVRGAERIAWNSVDFGSTRAMVGRDDLTASWTNRPFQLGWTPGEVLIVEVYGRRLARETVYFRTNMDTSDVFPLKSGTQTLVNLIDGAPVGKPEANRVKITSKRISDRPADAGATIARGDSSRSRSR